MPAAEQQIEALFYEALSCADAASRAALLADRCRADGELRRRVLKLLAAHDEMQDFLNSPASLLSALADDSDGAKGTPTTPAPLVNRSADAVPEIPTLSLVAGRYRLLKVLGEGGMGTVYQAEQTTPIVRHVAVKLLKPGTTSSAVVTRFEVERQALAVMDHENIARVYDGGATADGLPFFVMELVNGIPITRYCDNGRLSIDARLRLFITVCEALQHAHQKGIIHRDLKPGNVLVATDGSRAIPKVIDFGVAKALGPAVSPDRQSTAYGMVIGTPEYMSPEQANFEQVDIDTRSDVYSLGALLYELLAGSPPHGRYGEDHDSLLGMLQLIRQTEPVRPSLRVRAATDALTIAQARQETPGRLARVLHGELDAIVMKCLQTLREARYATAREVAEELARFLTGQPILARTAGFWERSRRWCRRNSTVALLLATVCLSLIAGISASLYFGITASERAVAEANARRAEFDARQRAQEQTSRAERERAQGLLQLARALRTGGRSGQRFAALRAVRESQQISGPSRALADEAASALCLPDWEVDCEWEGYPDGTEAFALAPGFNRYAVARADGSITVWSLPDNLPLVTFAGLGAHAAYGGLAFSQDGALLLERSDVPEPRIRCWDVATGSAQLRCELLGTTAALDATGNLLAAAVHDELQIWNLETATLAGRLRLGNRVNQSAFAWNPFQDSMVLKYERSWQVYDATRGVAGTEIPVAGTISSPPAIHPHGRWAILPRDRPLGSLLVDLTNGRQVAPAFERGTASGVVAFMSRQGDAVFTSDWTSALRMWEPTSGRELLARRSSANRSSLVVSPDNTRVGPEISSGSTVRTLRFASGRELQRVPLGSQDSPDILPEYHRFHHLDATGRILAVTTVEGVALIDVAAGVTITTLRSSHPQGIQATAFLSNGTLLTYGADGLLAWPLRLDIGSATLQLAPPDRSLASWKAWVPFDSHAAPDGSLIVLQAEVIDGEFTRGAAVIQWDGQLRSPARHLAIARGMDVKSVSVSPDGRYVATGVWSGVSGSGTGHASVWNPQGALVADIPSRELCRVKFTPSGSRLLVHSAENFECRVYQTDTWTRTSTQAARFMPVFSPDERLCVFTGEPGDLSLRTGQDLSEFALLQTPFEESLVPLIITPANDRLYFAGAESHRLFCVNLALIRQELDEMDLADAWPQISAPPPLPANPPLGVLGFGGDAIPSQDSEIPGIP